MVSAHKQIANFYIQDNRWSAELKPNLFWNSVQMKYNFCLMIRFNLKIRLLKTIIRNSAFFAIIRYFSLFFINTNSKEGKWTKKSQINQLALIRFNSAIYQFKRRLVLHMLQFNSKVEELNFVVFFL